MVDSHPCSVVGQTRCTGTDCGVGARYSSVCDADGCDFNVSPCFHDFHFRDIKIMSSPTSSNPITCLRANTNFKKPYRQGATAFYGKGKKIDTSSKMTVVTQFITNDKTDDGTLVEIKRFYVQNGVTYANVNSTVAGVPGNSIVIQSPIYNSIDWSLNLDDRPTLSARRKRPPSVITTCSKPKEAWPP